MSLNSAHANGGVLIFNGELILLYCDGVEMQFEGSDAKMFQGSKKGRLYLTTHRMIFVNKDTTDFLQSFSFPFFSLSSIELEQPIFGANFIKGKVKAQEGGNWTGHSQFKLRFNSGGAIEYGQAMLQAARLASRFMTAEPPPYTPAPGPYYAAPPPSYMPAAGAYYGFAPPTHMFPHSPPADSVFMTDAPPPYPGLNSGAGFNGPTYNGAAAFPPGDLKAQEAAASAPPNAYFNPSQPGFAYMPPPPAYQQQQQMPTGNYAPYPEQQFGNQFPPYPTNPTVGNQFPPNPAAGNQYPPNQAVGNPFPPYPEQPGMPPSYTEATKKNN